MSIRLGRPLGLPLGVTVVAATFLFGSVSSLRADDTGVPVTMSRPGGNNAMMFADLSRQAPIGHRQPRRVDVPETAQLSPEDNELRRIDKEVDRRLIICRGC